MKINKGKTNEELVNRYKARLKARKEKPVEEPVEEPVEQKTSKDGLVYALNNKIYLTQDFKDSIFLTSRIDTINALCVHNGELYAASGNSISTVSEASDRIVKTRERTVNALCSHNEILYDANARYIQEIFSNIKIAARRGEIKALCAHNGELYDAGLGIFKTQANEEISIATQVNALCSHDGNLYYAHKLSVFCFTKKGVNRVASRSDLVEALCSHNTNLLDGGRYGGIYATIHDMPFLAPTDGHTAAMCSVPPDLVERILKNKGVLK
ncbi:hypothetical protein GOV06_03375 [Candidatus Woesearchaeota archaeon]|nr:hypothetical protein [Candidatus Woesearchaeota archaeon]